jgi:hypothetical protein
MNRGILTSRGAFVLRAHKTVYFIMRRSPKRRERQIEIGVVCVPAQRSKGTTKAARTGSHSVRSEGDWWDGQTAKTDREPDRFGNRPDSTST